MIDKQPQIEEKDFASAPDSIHRYQGHYKFYCRYYMRQLMTIKSIHFNEAVPLLPLLFKLYWIPALTRQSACQQLLGDIAGIVSISFSENWIGNISAQF